MSESKCSNGVVGCIHDFPKPKDTMSMLAEIDFGVRTVCDKRYAFLCLQADKYFTWLIKQAWCNDLQHAENIQMKSYKETMAALKEQGQDNVTLPSLSTKDGEVEDYLIDVNYDNDIVTRLQDEAFQYENYWNDLEKDISSRFDFEISLEWYNNRLYSLNRELSLCDLLQDKIDELKSSEKHNILSTFKMIDKFRKDKELSFVSWFEFNNQLLELIGRSKFNQPKQELVNVADKINYYESKIDSLYEKFNPIFEQEDNHNKLEDSIDNYLVNGLSN